MTAPLGGAAEPVSAVLAVLAGVAVWWRAARLPAEWPAVGASALSLAVTALRLPYGDGGAYAGVWAPVEAVGLLALIAVTTFDLDEYVHAALRHGACGFLLKRSGPALLIEAVRAAVNGDTLISPEVTVRLIARKLNVRNRVGIALWAWDTGRTSP